MSVKPHGNSEYEHTREELCDIFLGTCDKVHHTFNAVTVPDFRFVFINHAQAKLLQEAGVLDPSEIIGKRPWDICSKWENVLLSVYSDILKSKQPKHLVDIELELPSRQTYWDASLVPIMSEAGEVISITMLAVEVTERKRAEDALRESEERFRAIFEKSRDGMFIGSTDGIPILYNRAMERISGYSKEEVVQRSWFELAHPEIEDRKYAIDLMEQVIEGKIPYAELQITRKDKTRIWTSFSGNMVTIGGQHHLLGHTVDITARKLAEQQLKEVRDAAEQAAAKEAEARATLQVILDTVPVGVMMADAQTHRITYFSPGVIEIMGGPVTPDATETIADAYEILRPDGSPLARDEMPLPRSLNYGERLYNVEVLIQRRDGSKAAALVNSAPVRDQNNRITAAVASITDITEMVNLRTMLEEQLTMLERALIPREPALNVGCKVASAYLPAYERREVSGDFYDAFHAFDGRPVVMIGDVSGKGIEAAALAATTRSTVRAFAYEYPSPGDAMARANAALYSQMPGFGSFVTVFLAVLDSEQEILHYSNAGHLPAAIYHNKTGEVEFTTSNGLAVGISPNYPMMTSHITLEPKDKLVMYTDGISEAWPGHGEFFGEEGIERVLRQFGQESPEEIISALLAATRDWAGGKLRDDAAVVIVECEALSGG
ncbi:MAG TPA: SpoIIE family protein phosphatase [Armatimonadota bacterium]|nr:SpoIIE family protein phosphatase [Armatimonadota bacterium]